VDHTYTIGTQHTIIGNSDEFRTLLRRKLFDSKKEESPPTGRSSEPGGPDSEVEAGISPPRPGRQDEGAAASAGPSPKEDDTGRDRSALVNKIVEGLRGDVFLIARDLGLETLTQEGGLERLVERIKAHVMSFLEPKKKPRNSLEQARKQVEFYPDNPKNPC
jgi:hypothetical protein